MYYYIFTYIRSKRKSADTATPAAGYYMHIHIGNYVCIGYLCFSISASVSRHQSHTRSVKRGCLWIVGCLTTLMALPRP